MRQSREYKSPYAALIWSLLMPGFGQLYNRDYVAAFVLLGLELLINTASNLNAALFHTFSGNLAGSHMISYQWGIFYPSMYAFAIWQAFNAAKVNNVKAAGRPVPQRTYFTGFFAGMALGMDFGLFWNDTALLRKWLIFHMPVSNGVLFGLAGAIIGSVIEKILFPKKKTIVEK